MKNTKNIIMAIFAVIAIVAVVFAFNLNSQIKSLKKATDQGTFSAEDVEKVVEEVGQVIVLPEGETPTVATVSDPSALKDQPFFAKAEAGDTVLIYSTSRKAILWRPSTGKIIEVSPISLPTPPAEETVVAPPVEQEAVATSSVKKR